MPTDRFSDELILQKHCRTRESSSVQGIAIGLSQVLTGILLYAHFKKHGFRPVWRILAVLVTLCGFFVAFGEFFYQLGRHSR